MNEQNARHLNNPKDQLQKAMDANPDVVLIAYRNPDEGDWKILCGWQDGYPALEVIGVAQLMLQDAVAAQNHYDAEVCE